MVKSSYAIHIGRKIFKKKVVYCKSCSSFEGKKKKSFSIDDIWVFLIGIIARLATQG